MENQDSYIERKILLNILEDERLVKEKLKQWEIIFKFARWGIAVTSSDGKHIETVNHAMAEMHGCEIDEMKGSSFLDFIPEYLHDDTKEKFKILSEENYISLETVHKRKDGSTFPVQIDASNIFDDQGKFLYRVANCIDITEKVRFREELYEKDKFISGVANTAPALIYVYDMVERRNVYANNGIESILGYSPDEVKSMGNKLLPLLMHPDDLPAAEIYHNNFMTAPNNKTMSFEYRMKHKNGNWIYLRSQETLFRRDAEKNVLQKIGIAFDITEQKKMYAELLEAKEEAEGSDRLKSEFLAQISHEIRTPINVIVNFISLVQEEVSQYNSEDLKSFFTSIDSGSKRLIRTIDLLLNVSQLQSGKIRPKIEQTDLVEKILKTLIPEFSTALATKNLSLELQTETKDTIINADHYMVTQIFQNLIDNAIKYTKRGGITIRISRNDKNLLIAEVSDTGIGIAKEFLPQIFSRFTQESQGYTRSFDGVGLGLTLVKQYCNLNTIQISVDSTKGEGTTFTLIFSK